MDLASLVKRAFAVAGLDVYRLSDRRRRTIDAYAAQEWLLRGRPVRTILDVGANIGQTAEKYHRLFPAAAIYSFEPFEQAYSSLSAKFRDVPKVHPQQLAVADAVGKRRLFVNQESVTNSLLPGAGAQTPVAQMTPVGATDVNVTTLDAFCAEKKIDSADILKMDIQGGELLALQGARELLSRKAITLVYTEVLFSDLYEGQATFPQLMQFLTDHGYILYGLYDLQYPEGQRLAWGDAIFITPGLTRDR
jgi:FkbM family methyltransferase